MWKREPGSHDLYFYSLEDWVSTFPSHFNSDLYEHAEMAGEDLLRMLHRFQVIEWADFCDGEPTIWMRQRQ